MSNKQTDFPFYDCVVAADSFSFLLALKSEGYCHGLQCILIDLLKFDKNCRESGEEKVIKQYLASQEREYWHKLTSKKRKREWLGGRFAAKYVAAEILIRAGHEVEWSRLSVCYDTTGRPFLAADDINSGLPDISISHSGDMAAAMAVGRGLCGIDIQKITDRVIKVRHRFCSKREEQVLNSFFSNSSERPETHLTKLWAAKEALRKVEKNSIVPGFLELELKRIKAIPVSENTASWRFSFTRKQSDLASDVGRKNYTVALSRIADYVLALVTTDDIVA